MSDMEPQGAEPQTPGSPAETKAECQRPKKLLWRPSGGSFIETVAGAATVILAIIGLAGMQNPYLLAVLTIVIGVALLAEGCSLLCRCGKILCQTQGACQPPPMGGVSCELLAGGVGVVLGLLALLGVAAEVLIPVAVIVFGASLANSSCLKAKLCCMECCACEKCEVVRNVAHEAAMAAAGAQVLVGMAAVILGILGVLGHSTILLSFVGLLVLGFAFVLCGVAKCGRMFMPTGHV
jgi:hypothetical protein